MKVKEIASIISQIENNSPKKKKILSKLYAKTGNAHRIGITGPPGAGKSSLINNLISNIREIKKTVAVICIDPTSPFSGGAVLGDRIRMLKHHSDKGVYVRSMASRNASGGLSLASSEAADVLDSFGFDFIIFETLGVGQPTVTTHIKRLETSLDIILFDRIKRPIKLTLSGKKLLDLASPLIEGIDSFLIKTTDRPKWSIGMTEIPFMNSYRRIANARGKWSSISVVLYDPIAPSGAQQVMEWIRTHHESVSGRAGYADFYKRDIQVKVLDPVGTVVELWDIKGAFISAANFQSLAYDGEGLMMIDLTLEFDNCVLQF